MSSSKNLGRAHHARHAVACLAARLMAEDGISDYGLAKKKAARQLGVADTDGLPNNAEIEAELRTYQNLYQGEEQAQRVQVLRETAVQAMEFLAEFRPYLTGSVLSGTAGRYARVDLEVFVEDSKAVELFLLNRGVDYHHESVRANPFQEPPESLLAFDWDDVPVCLAVYDSYAERQRRRNHAGQPLERARLDAVRALLQEAP